MSNLALRAHVDHTQAHGALVEAITGALDLHGPGLRRGILSDYPCHRVLGLFLVGTTPVPGPDGRALMRRTRTGKRLATRRRWFRIPKGHPWHWATRDAP
jgi:hypothetical protein